MADHKCAAVPLAEQLRSVPQDAVLRIDTPNALGCMDTRSIPVGRLCHEAADALGMPVAKRCGHCDGELPLHGGPAPRCPVGWRCAHLTQQQSEGMRTAGVDAPGEDQQR